MEIINKVEMGYIDFDCRKVIKPTKLELSDNTLDYLHTKIEKLTSLKQDEVLVGQHHELISSAHKAVENDLNFNTVNSFVLQKLFNLGINVENMPATHVLFLDLKTETSNYYCIVKLNNKRVDRVSTDLEGNLKIIKGWQMPTPKSPIEEAIIINVNSNKIHIIEKKFSIDGRQDTYLNNQWIKGELQLSYNDVFKYTLKVVNRVNLIYKIYEDSKLKALVNDVLMEMISTSNEFYPHKLINEIFECDYNANEEALEIIKDLGIDNDTYIPTEMLTKNYKFITLKTSTGIEIKVDVQDYLDGENITLDSSNGQRSMVIKGVDNLEVK